MHKLGEYSVLPLAGADHTFYIRKHEPKIPTENDSRSLFLVNVPIDSTPAHFRALFSTLIGAGRFESIAFNHEPELEKETPVQALQKQGKKRKRAQEKVENVELSSTWDRACHKSGSTAVVLLLDDKSVKATLSAIRKLHEAKKDAKWPVWGEGVEGKVPALGSARYLTHQKTRYPDPATLQAAVDAFMTKWNADEEEKARMAKRQRNLPDEDGFVTVTRGGRTGPARQEDAERKRAEMEEKEQNKREGMGDFYRFQMRERRKAEQGELVKQFEEDKKRVEVMKEQRGRFRPER